MRSEPVITVENVSKTYRIYGSPFGRIQEMMPWNKRQRHQKVHAVQNLSFEVYPGQCIGLVGGNGAGKSTLLKILTGTTFPDTGRYSIRGKVASLLELGAGFTMDFSGRENIYMNGAMMGISHREMKQRFDEILDFSELHDFIDAPLRTYSSGMICRLGFSVALATDPEVLIIDEILAVGDMRFQAKCIERIHDYKRRGKTLFFCSHSLYDVRQICDEAIWMHDGEMKMKGGAIAVTNEYSTYQSQISAEKVAHPEPISAEHDAELPHVVSAVLIDLDTGKPRNRFSPGDNVGVRMHIKNGQVTEEMSLGVAVTDSKQNFVFAASTEIDQMQPLDFPDEGVVTCELPNLKLLAGEYVVVAALLDKWGVHRFHKKPTSANLVVENWKHKELGVFLHDHEWKVERLV